MIKEARCDSVTNGHIKWAMIMWASVLNKTCLILNKPPHKLQNCQQ
jgi:hypothetical protein